MFEIKIKRNKIQIISELYSVKNKQTLKTTHLIIITMKLLRISKNRSDKKIIYVCIYLYIHI